MKGGLAVFAGGALALAGCTSVLGDFSVGGASPAGEAGAPNDAGASDGATVADGEAGAKAPPPADGGVDATLDATVDAGADATVDGGSTPPGDAAGEPLSCAGTLTACGESCVDLTSSPLDCGACGHDCGGGVCQSSRCQPFVLQSGIEPPTAFAIDSRSLYFGLGGAIQSCPLAGCAFGSTQIVSGFMEIRQIAVGPDYLLFIQATNTTVRIGGAPAVDVSIDSCPLGPCPSPQILVDTDTSVLSNVTLAGGNLFFLQSGCGGLLCRPGNTFSNLSQCAGFSPGGCDGGVVTLQSGLAPIAADTSSVYFTFDEDAGADAAPVPTLSACPVGGACDTPQVLRPNAPPSSTELVAFSGSLFFNGEISFMLGKSPVDLWSCPATDCSSATSLAGLSDAVTSFAVDSSGVYLAAGSTIYECPVQGCGADAVPIATGQTAPQMVLSDSRYVYWVDGDMTASDGGVIADSGAILRVAK